MNTPELSEVMRPTRTSRGGPARRAWLVALLLALPGIAWSQTSGNGGGNNPPSTGGTQGICNTCDPGDPPPLLPLDAQFVSQSVPTAMVAGQSYPVSIQLSNAGSQTWTAAGSFNLGSQNPGDNLTWGAARVGVPASILTGQGATFAYNVTAPATAGIYHFQWRMVQDGVAWFGASTPNVSVVVTAANNAPAVQLTSPAPNGSATAPTAISLAASASDTGGSIASVSFWSGATLLGTDSTAPYAWSIPSAVPGTYVFKAVATDNSGVSTTSAVVNFNVVLATVNGVSATRTYVYDANQRLCKTINPESGATVVDYDAAGNVAWIAEGTSLTTAVCDRSLVTTTQKVVRKYDVLNRVKLVETPGGTANLATTYYLDGQVKSFAAVNPGKNTVTTSYSYNKRRLITAESSSNGSTLFTLGYGYNANGVLAALTYPDNQTVTYAPDALGRATQVVSTAGVAYATEIKYWPSGAISSFIYGNGIKHSMQPNERLLPTRSLDSHFVGTTEIKVLDDTYAFDPNANVTDIVDRAQNGLTTRGMAYDGADRLTAAVSPLQWGNATYGYDALDNLRSADQGTRQYRYNYDAANRLASIKSPTGAAIFAFAYDSHGNTLSKNSQGYQFDSVNRMSQVTGLQTYRYDGQGRRVQTTDSDNKTTFWIYSQSGQVIYTSEARRNQNVSYIYLGNSQIATRAVAWTGGGVTLRFQHTDALGSPVAETDPLRNIMKRNSYAPYGEAYGATVVDGTGYTGHVMDRATGLTYMQQRYYDPVVGRFLSIDPIGSDIATAWNWNRYNYAASNPFRFKDPDGRIIDIVADAIFITADVAAIASEGATLTNVLALGADVVCAVVPGATGGGVGVRAVSASYKGSALARAMSNAGHAVEKGVEQAHHLVAQGSKHAGEARDVMKKLGIDIHSALNGAAVKTASHAVLHTKAYYKRVNSLIVAASKSKTPRESVEKVLAALRKESEK
jgi:RHS repeat-associated protein